MPIPINDHIIDNDNSIINRNPTKGTPCVSPLIALDFNIQSCNNLINKCSQMIEQSQQRHDTTIFNTRFDISTKENIDQIKS